MLRALMCVTSAENRRLKVTLSTFATAAACFTMNFARAFSSESVSILARWGIAYSPLCPTSRGGGLPVCTASCDSSRIGDRWRGVKNSLDQLIKAIRPFSEAQKPDFGQIVRTLLEDGLPLDPAINSMPSVSEASPIVH